MVSRPEAKVKLRKGRISGRKSGCKVTTAALRSEQHSHGMTDRRNRTLLTRHGGTELVDEDELW